jgi:hypothetical protein
MAIFLKEVTRRVNANLDAVRRPEIRLSGKILGFAKFRHGGSCWQSASVRLFSARARLDRVIESVTRRPIGGRSAAVAARS